MWGVISYFDPRAENEVFSDQAETTKKNSRPPQVGRGFFFVVEAWAEKTEVSAHGSNYYLFPGTEKRLFRKKKKFSSVVNHTIF